MSDVTRVRGYSFNLHPDLQSDAEWVSAEDYDYAERRAQELMSALEDARSSVADLADKLDAVERERDVWKLKVPTLARENALLRLRRIRLRHALAVARRWIVDGEPEIGWSIDRIDEVLHL